MTFIQATKTLAISTVLWAFAYNAQATNLLDIYQQAFDHDAQYKIAIHSYASTQESRSQAKAAFLPQIKTVASASHNDINNDRNDSYSGSQFSLSLNQSIYNRGSQIAIKQADLGVAQAQAELTSAEQDLIFRAADAYFGVLAAKENLQFANSEKQAIEQQLEQAERRFEVGLIAVTDVKEAQAAFDFAVAEEIAAENNLSNANEALRVMTGTENQVLATLNEVTPLIKPDPINIEQWVSTAKTSNLSLRIAEYAAEIATQQIRASRAGHYPTLGAGANYNNLSQKGGPGDSETGVIQLQLDVPLYSGGLVSSKTRQAKSQAMQAAQQYELTKRNTAQLTRNSYRGVLASISRVIAFKQALQSTQIAAEATETGFEVGTRTAVDVLQSLRDTYRARANYSNARYDYILNSLRLKQAAGILRVPDLESVNSWLKPE